MFVLFLRRSRADFKARAILVLRLPTASLRSSNTGDIFAQLFGQHYCVASWKGLLPVLPSSLSTCHTTNFDVASCDSLRKSCLVIGRQCVFVLANKMACWPSVVSFFYFPCQCRYVVVFKTVWWMLNFWHNSSRALDLRDLFLYCGPQGSDRHGCFSSSLHKSFLWSFDIFSLINSQSWVSIFSTSTT